MNHNTKTKLLYLASFLIPAALLLGCLAWVEAVPFGNNTILFEDAKIQYVDFVGYLRSILSGENDLFYSFNKNMGGELISLISYYLASPFNLLFAFASDEGLPLVFTIVMVLKLSMCGLTFYHASSRLYGCKAVHLAFSTAYALCAYNVLYCWSIMWLDGVLILPLVGLGLYELWKGKGPWLYSASLAYGLFTNFYIGYMLCITSVLFSLVHMLMLEEWKAGIRRFGRFLGASCLGGFASAAMWVPAFLALLEGRAKFDGNFSGILINFNILGLAGKLVAGASSPIQMAVGTPHIFCGTLVLFLVMAFFLNGKIPAKKRLCALAVLAVLLVSFLFAPVNVIWHGFSPNYAFNFRYAFVFNYVLVMLAQYALTRMPEVRRKWLVLAGGLLLILDLGMLAISLLVPSIDFLSTVGCLVSGLALAAVFGSLVWPGRSRKGVCTLLILVSVVEMGINCGLSWDAVVGRPETPMTQMDSYNAFHQSVTPAVEYVKTLDTGFYRMEKTFCSDMNDPMFFGYNGLSHFSSSQQKHILRFLEKMGLKNDQDICVYYNTGSTAEVDSLLGVKYVLSRTDLTAARGYELLDTVNDIGIYRNENALPVAFLSQPEVASVDMNEADYFALHNTIWQAVSTAEEDILTKAAVKAVVLENLEPIPMENGAIRYLRKDTGKPASIRYEIEVDRELPLYFYFTSDEAQDARIFINGVDNGVYFHLDRWDMTNAGTFPVGDTVTIEVSLLSEQILIQDALFYYEDLEVLSCHAEAVLENPVEVTQQSSSHLKGSFTAKGDQLLLFTIPYDTGWRLYIDGRSTPYTMVMDALMAAEVEEGTHSFELRFMPRGLAAGCTLTVAAILTGLGWYAQTKKKGAAYGKKA